MWYNCHFQHLLIYILQISILKFQGLFNDQIDTRLGEGMIGWYHKKTTQRMVLKLKLAK
jgi:hypothetical protein